MVNDVRRVSSRDGTTIAFEQTGSGLAVIVVASALSTRSDAKRLAALLAADFTVINYDRRGRGDSGDTPPYAVEREVEDIDALIEHAAGPVCVFGSSSGAALALEAAASGLRIEKVALFEPPFVVAEDDHRPPADFREHLASLIDTGRHGEAVRYFMTKGIGMPAIFVHMMRLAPKSWSAMKAMAPTIPYDLAVMGDNQAGKPLAAGQWQGATMPTLVLTGGKSPEFLRHGATALADVLPNARLRTLDKLNHGAVVMSPKTLAPVLSEFFTS
jgi:pimeloyl-ACP methyl ester carboxylesterase